MGPLPGNDLPDDLLSLRPFLLYHLLHTCSLFGSCLQTRYAATFTCQGSGDLLPACIGPGREGQATRHDGRVSGGRLGRPGTSFPQVWPSWKGMGREMKATKN